MWIEMHPSWSLARRVYTSANSPGEGAEVVGSLVDVARRAKNSSLFMSTPSRKVSSPNRTLSGTTSMSKRSRHALGRSAVESVTTANERFTLCLRRRARRAHFLDRQNERVVLLPALLDLDLQTRVSRANVRFELVELIVASPFAA